MTTRSSHSFYPLRASYTFATDSSPYHIPIARAAELPHSGLRRIDNFQTIDEANQDRSGVASHRTLNKRARVMGLNKLEWSVKVKGS